MGITLRRFTILLLAIFMWMGIAAPTNAMVKSIHDYDTYREYIGVTGVLTGRNAFYRMLVPKSGWNGTLLMYARGTVSTLLFDKESGLPIFDDPSGIPKVGVTPMTNLPGDSLGDNDANDALEKGLLKEGFALAASDYRYDKRFADQGLLSWVVQDGVIDTAALTLEAHRLLHRDYGPVSRTLLWGRSQGSLVAIKLMESAPWLFRGVVTGGTVGAGATRNWDQGLTAALAFDVALGWDSKNWGSVGGGDIPAGISFNRDVAPGLLRLLENPNNFGRFEFIRLVTGAPDIGYYPVSGWETFNWLFAQMLFMTEVRGDLESAAKAGGAICQNLNRTYSLSDDQKAYLKSLGVDADDLLQQMNARPKYRANRAARRYLKENYDIKGWDLSPLISMHTTVDGLVLPANESALANKVKIPRNLVQVYVDAAGHCAFTANQWETAVDNLVKWLDTGVRPTKDDFPTDEHFDPDYIPPSWPR
jgi:pimeloyl-ACP methyl ester carboxylesterase